jgi:hypothetical protein
MDFIIIKRATQVFSAIDYLEEIFEDLFFLLIIMLQEIHHKSFLVILDHFWIKKNFALLNTYVPQCYFTFIMVFQYIQMQRWFCILFQNRINGDIFIIDLPISSFDKESKYPKKILKFYTIHFLYPLQKAKGEERRSR